MAFPLGLVIAVVSIIAAVTHLKQEAHYFWDFVAFACVFGGTLAVAVITLPWQYRKIVFKSLLSLVASPKIQMGEFLAECIEYIKAVREGNTHFQPSSSGLGAQILRDGAELISLGFERKKIHSILEERIHQYCERQQRVANAVRSLAKYPPAFGLAGTVLGLVTLMRAVSAGADAKQTGLVMAVALMATFYGLLVSNLIVNPAGEYLAKKVGEERKLGEVAIHSVLLAGDQASLLEAQETLNSYVPEHHRVNVIRFDVEGAA